MDINIYEYGYMYMDRWIDTDRQTDVQIKVRTQVSSWETGLKYNQRTVGYPHNIIITTAIYCQLLLLFAFIKNNCLYNMFWSWLLFPHLLSGPPHPLTHPTPWLVSLFLQKRNSKKKKTVLQSPPWLSKYGCSDNTCLVIMLYIFLTGFHCVLKTHAACTSRNLHNWTHYSSVTFLFDKENSLCFFSSRLTSARCQWNLLVKREDCSSPSLFLRFR